MPSHALNTLGPYQDINYLNITNKIPEDCFPTALLGFTLSELVDTPNLGCLSSLLHHLDWGYTIPYEMQLQTHATVTRTNFVGIMRTLEGSRRRWALASWAVTGVKALKV